MPIFVPAQPYPKKANDNIRSSDWNSAIDEVMRLSDATQYLNRNTFNGPLTISGLLTAGAGLTVTGELTASGGIKGPLTVNGALTVNGVLGVSTYTRISQQTSGNWAIFGANMYNTGNVFKLVNTAQPGANLHISAEGGGSTQFRFCLMDAGETNQRNIATIGTGGLTVNGGINGYNGALAINASFMSLSETTVVATNATGGPWASFGSNAYYHGNGWKLANTAQAGVCLQMSGPGGGTKEFRFVRVEANSTTGTILGSIGTEGLTVSGALKASGGITGPITVNGSLKVGSTGGMLEVGSLTIISQNTAGSWSGFGKNLYIAENGSWLLKDTGKPGVNFHMSADGAAEKEFRFARRDANSTVDVHLATIGTGGLTVPGGIRGVDGRLTIHDSFLSVEGLAVVSTSISGGRWASFGSNAYYRGNQWNLADTAQPGVCLVMSATGGGTDREFAFCRKEVGSAPATDLVKMGRDGIVVHNGKKVATGYEFLYMVRGQVEANGNASIGTGFTASKIGTGIYQINFNPPFSNWPIVVATQRGPENSNTRDNALIVGIGYEWAKIKVGDDGGTARDRQFTFIAVGPRTT